MKNILAIDIDGTWDTDPLTFYTLARMFTFSGWRVIIVTGSPQPEEKIVRLGIWDAIRLDPQGFNLPIITCQPGELKLNAAKAAGYDVTVWMDNEPGTIEPQRKLTEPKDEEL